MPYLLDTNTLSELIRHPRGRVADRIREVGNQNVCTSIIVAAELYFGASKKRSPRLSAQIEVVLDVMRVLPLETPVEVIYGDVRAQLESTGRPIGGNDLLIAAQCLALQHTLITSNEREFSRIESLTIENWLR
jgi:tRNA(fMet)-specific endonuclease VapC